MSSSGSADPRADSSAPPPADADEFNEFPDFLEGDATESPDEDSAPRVPGEMGFLDHLEEFRLTAIKCLVCILVGMGIVGAFFPFFFHILLFPLDHAVRLAHVDPKSFDTLYSNSLMGVFTVILEVTLFGGIALSLPAVGYFVIRFVAPGLTDREKGLLRPALLSALLLFIAGALFSFFFLVPASLAVSLKLNAALHLNPLWNAADYYELVSWLILGTGLIFEFPLILVILQVLGVVSTGQLRQYRRHAVVVILVIAAVIAPPEVVAMFLMAAPMYLLFEVSLLVGERLRRTRLAAQAAEAEAGSGE